MKIYLQSKDYKNTSELSAVFLIFGSEIMINIFENCIIEKDIKKIIDNDLRSKTKKRAKKGKDYYNAKHDILDFRVFYFNSDGQLVEDTVRSNIKISHAFYTELIDQKTSYLLSGFDVYSEEEQLNNELKIYFDDNFKSELSEVVENASKIGFSYMYAQLGKDFRTHFKLCRRTWNNRSYKSPKRRSRLYNKLFHKAN